MSLACCEIFHTVLVFLLSALCKGLRDSKWFSRLACKYQRLSSLRPPLWYFSLPWLPKGFSRGQVWIPARQVLGQYRVCCCNQKQQWGKPWESVKLCCEDKWLTFQKPKWFLFRAPLNLFSWSTKRSAVYCSVYLQMFHDCHAFRSLP